MSLIKKAFREFGSKEVEIDCLSVSDASEKSEEKDNSAATERQKRFSGQKSSSLKKSTIDLQKLNKELKMNQKKLPGYVMSSLSLHQFEAIQEENESHDSKAEPRRNTKNSKFVMLSRGETENTKGTKLKSVKPLLAQKKVVIKPELS